MAMSTQAKGLLLFLAVVTYASGARGDSHTFITNQSSQDLVATFTYSPGTSGFTNRVIAAGAADSDEYSPLVSTVHVKLGVNGSPNQNTFDIDGDRSLVAKDHGTGSTGVDIFLAKFGTQVQIDGPVITTVFP